MRTSGAWREHPSWILRVAAGAVVLVALAAAGAPAQAACDDRFAWTCEPATPAPAPQAAPEQTEPPPAAAPAATAPTAAGKPAAVQKRTRTTAPVADAPTAFTTPNPDLRRDQATGSVRPAGRDPRRDAMGDAAAAPDRRQPDPRATAQSAGERATLPRADAGVVFGAPPAAAPAAMPDVPAYQPVRSDPPAAAPAAAADGAAEPPAPRPRPMPMRPARRIVPAEDPPLMSPLRWVFVAWGGALAVGSAIRLLF
jgi:hypothetical protein